MISVEKHWNIAAPTVTKTGHTLQKEEWERKIKTNISRGHIEIALKITVTTNVFSGKCVSE